MYVGYVLALEKPPFKPEIAAAVIVGTSAFIISVIFVTLNAAIEAVLFCSLEKLNSQKVPAEFIEACSRNLEELRENDV